MKTSEISYKHTNRCSILPVLRLKTKQSQGRKEKYAFSISQKFINILLHNNVATETCSRKLVAKYLYGIFIAYCYFYDIYIHTYIHNTYVKIHVFILSL